MATTDIRGEADHDIDISVQTQYLSEQSDPENDRYAFAYTIGIENRGPEAVKLLSRHWVITDDNNQVEDVRGEGVVGLQPLIQPGQKFVYTSGAVLTTEFGTMQGSYKMAKPDGSQFDADIPAFLLSRPHSVH
ncbi:Co2+/Mg2+ efflux protein ApaG [Pseudohongiella sp.]|uniref:Protein ApaG n=1 Tax=marine sediment metagenome TaxID=412755 RepID=A0A0F9VNZ0_9ZZZZ|nr:Co2+/Mg2+ efflux protein ApaG [Pseudohongiella sp.]HDZ10012.1 Co2+/Mg2+ efflux protein ApaG [Pseudohongiella sp.]HEA63908.1 Co2+/Mg2+ efflux protein ApaG [Pseudohongiella sp.]